MEPMFACAVRAQGDWHPSRMVAGGLGSTLAAYVPDITAIWLWQPCVCSLRAGCALPARVCGSVAAIPHCPQQPGKGRRCDGLHSSAAGLGWW